MVPAADGGKSCLVQKRDLVAGRCMGGALLVDGSMCRYAGYCSKLLDAGGVMDFLSLVRQDAATKGERIGIVRLVGPDG